MRKVLREAIQVEIILLVEIIWTINLEDMPSDAEKKSDGGQGLSHQMLLLSGNSKGDFKVEIQFLMEHSALKYDDRWTEKNRIRSLNKGWVQMKSKSTNLSRHSWQQTAKYCLQSNNNSNMIKCSNELLLCSQFWLHNKLITNTEKWIKTFKS